MEKTKERARIAAGGEKTHAGPSHVAYQVSDLGEGKKAVWSRVGAAFAHRDGKGYDVRLDAVPVDGRIVLRTKDDLAKHREK